MLSVNDLRNGFGVPLVGICEKDAYGGRKLGRSTHSKPPFPDGLGVILCTS